MDLIGSYILLPRRLVIIYSLTDDGIYNSIKNFLPNCLIEEHKTLIRIYKNTTRQFTDEELMGTIGIDSDAELVTTFTYDRYVLNTMVIDLYKDKSRFFELKQYLQSQKLLLRIDMFDSPQIKLLNLCDSIIKDNKDIGTQWIAYNDTSAISLIVVTLGNQFVPLTSSDYGDIRRDLASL